MSLRQRKPCSCPRVDHPRQVERKRLEGVDVCERRARAPPICEEAR
ncbi:hypothetical protein BF49_6659 [Bradyrhizobium sp.]|nr:hypothetical protein BF49_6659 [Bradyrhizobium sp.]